MDLRSGAAYWEIKNGLLHTYPALQRDEVAEVAVIGGGVTGALVAHRLAVAGADVVVLDRRDVATGSTAATTGLLQYETDTPLSDLMACRGPAHAVRAWQLGGAAISAIEQLCTEIGDPCGFARQAAFYVASTARETGALAAEYESRVRAGFEVEWMDGATLESRHGVMAPAAIVTPDAAYIDCYRFTHVLLAHLAARFHVRIYDRTEVIAVTPAADHVVLRTSRNAQVRARRVVWAAGYESVEETQKHVARHQSTWALVSEPLGQHDAPRLPGLLWETARPYLYARMTDDDRVMLGGADHPSASRHANARWLVKQTDAVLARLARLVPSIDLEVAYRWAGVFSSTKDGLPYIGATPEHPHAWLAMGYGGNGITFSTIAADLIRDAWLGIANPDAEIFAFGR